MVALKILKMFVSVKRASLDDFAKNTLMSANQIPVYTMVLVSTESMISVAHAKMGLKVCLVLFLLLINFLICLVYSLPCYFPILCKLDNLNL